MNPPPPYLFVGTHGHVAALDPQDGRQVWQTSLPGTGYEVVSILYEDGLLFCASGGKAFALHPEDGSIVWENELQGLGRGLVFLATARSSAAGGMTVLAAHQAQQASLQSGGG